MLEKRGRRSHDEYGISMKTQVAVVGAGAAGLYTALSAAQRRARVILVSATPWPNRSTYWAQGGLAAAMSDEDSPELHCADTVKAGRAMVRESAARVLAEDAPDAVRAPDPSRHDL